VDISSTATLVAVELNIIGEEQSRETRLGLRVLPLNPLAHLKIAANGAVLKDANGKDIKHAATLCREFPGLRALERETGNRQPLLPDASRSPPKPPIVSL
jgi:hypothetical protein